MTAPKTEPTVFYRIKCPVDVWEQFKEVSPKSKTLSETIVGLIREDVKKKKGKVS